MVFRIAICDDEPTIGSEIENIVAAYSRKSGISVQTDVFHSGEELCKVLEAGELYHLLYLDIRMKLLDGIQVSRKIREEYMDDTMQIVYVSSSQAHTMEMFESRPLNFLLKPIQEEDIGRTLEKAVSLMELGDFTFEFQNGNRQYRIHCGEIIYFASNNKKILAYTTGMTHEFYGKLSLVEKQLPARDFIMIHKSYLVNYRHIREAQYDSLVMSSGVQLPISQTFRKTVRDFLIQRRKEDSNA